MIRFFRFREHMVSTRPESSNRNVYFSLAKALNPIADSTLSLQRKDDAYIGEGGTGLLFMRLGLCPTDPTPLKSAGA